MQVNYFHPEGGRLALRWVNKFLIKIKIYIDEVLVEILAYELELIMVVRTVTLIYYQLLYKAAVRNFWQWSNDWSSYLKEEINFLS